MSAPHTPLVSLIRQLLLHQNLMYHLPHTIHHHHLPIPCTPPPTTTPNSPGLCFTEFANPSISAYPLLNKLQFLQSQFHSFQDKVRVIFASLSDQLTKMETRLSAKLDIVEVQTEYVDEDDPAVLSISSLNFSHGVVSWCFTLSNKQFIIIFLGVPMWVHDVIWYSFFLLAATMVCDN